MFNWQSNESHVQVQLTLIWKFCKINLGLHIFKHFIFSHDSSIAYLSCLPGNRLFLLNVIHSRFFLVFISKTTAVVCDCVLGSIISVDYGPWNCSISVSPSIIVYFFISRQEKVFLASANHWSTIDLPLIFCYWLLCEVPLFFNKTECDRTWILLAHSWGESARDLKIYLQGDHSSAFA